MMFWLRNLDQPCRCEPTSQGKYTSCRKIVSEHCVMPQVCRLAQTRRVLLQASNTHLKSVCLAQPNDITGMAVPRHSSCCSLRDYIGAPNREFCGLGAVAPLFVVVESTFRYLMFDLSNCRGIGPGLGECTPMNVSGGECFLESGRYFNLFSFLFAPTL